MTAKNQSRSLRAMENDGLMVDGARVIITGAGKLMALAQIEPLMNGPDAINLTEAATLP